MPVPYIIKVILSGESGADGNRFMIRALSLAGLTGQELVVDAYCSIGTIGIIASKTAGKVLAWN